MRLKKEPDSPEWMKKIDPHAHFQITQWDGGEERAPNEIHCFIMSKGHFTDDQKDQLTALGVVLNSTGHDINTGNIPYVNLQQVCELDFVVRIEFPKRLYPNRK